MKFDAYYYSGNSSARETVTVELIGDHLRILSSDLQSDFLLSKVTVTDRIGNAPRILKFPDGSSCEATDNDSIDYIMSVKGRDKTGQFVHTLENKWKYVFTALAITIAFTFLFIQYGIPTIANKAAFALPLKTNQIIAKHSLEFLDKQLFADSTLDDARKNELQTAFNQLTSTLPEGFKYELHFRAGKALGANALALPSGTIVMTDELVQLAETDKELHAVLAHELGHVVHRHGLRSLLQNSIISVIVIAITGDLSSLSVGIPTLLVESKYSREFEREADIYAINMMSQNEIPAHHFADILTRLSEKHKMPSGRIVNYISTHPATEDRVKIILNTP